MKYYIELQGTCWLVQYLNYINKEYDKHFISIIGKNFEVDKYGEDKLMTIKELKNEMASLKWHIWESVPEIKRAELEKDNFDEYEKNISYKELKQNRHIKVFYFYAKKLLLAFFYNCVKIKYIWSDTYD